VYASSLILFHKADGGEWEEQPDLGYVNAFWGSSPTNLYAVGNYGNAPTVYHSTGDGEWDAQTSPMASQRGISGTSADHIFIAGGPWVSFSRGDGTWTAQLTDEEDAFLDVWAQSRDAVYACTQLGAFYRSNGAGTWSERQSINGRGFDISFGCYTVWASAPDNVYVGTSSGVYRGRPAN